MIDFSSIIDPIITFLGVGAILTIALHGLAAFHGRPSDAKTDMEGD